MKIVSKSWWFLTGILFLFGCRNSADLGDGYSLRKKSAGAVIANDSSVIVGPAVQGIVILDDYISGWKYGASGQISYFIVNKALKKVDYFKDLVTLNNQLDLMGMPPFDMSKETTYWDLKTGQK